MAETQGIIPITMACVVERRLETRKRPWIGFVGASPEKTASEKGVLRALLLRKEGAKPATQVSQKN